MTQPLNYTPKAIEVLLNIDCRGAPASAAGLRYLANKLRQAQVFVLSDHGQLLDRSKPTPQVSGEIFRPPFPVVALEYLARPAQWGGNMYNAAPCSRRISLAWDWHDDLPSELSGCAPKDLGEGVVIASIAFFDQSQMWVPITGAIHVAYDAPWHTEIKSSHFKQTMLESGQLTKECAKAPGMSGSPIILLPELLVMATAGMTPASRLDVITADTMDEVNAYTDLCYALACKNVSTKSHSAPKNLNRQRIKAGKLPLMGFHVLELNGGGEMPGAGGAHDRAGPRSHLRRGHIRRLGADRVTWVNSTVVRGRGFVDKVYAA
jgi:hypothetical protein